MYRRVQCSPLLSNIYLNEVDKMLERAKQVTQYQRWTYVEYARFADDMVILVNSHRRQQRGFGRQLRNGFGRNWQNSKWR